MKKNKKDYTRYLNVKKFSKKLFKRLKYKKQRAKWGFCSYDAMDIDIWFLQVMPRIIEYLKDHHVGYPTFLLEEYYEQNKDKLGMSEFDFYACIPSEDEDNKNKQEQKFNINIEVFVKNLVDEQIKEDWYDFASNIESIIERKFTIKNIFIDKNENNLSQCISFYKKDNIGEKIKGLIVLNLSNLEHTEKKNKAKLSDFNDELFSINVNNHLFDSYNSALKNIENYFNNLEESITNIEKQKIIDNADKYCNEKWNGILDRMIFLFDEYDDEKCSMQNEFDWPKESDKYCERQSEINKYQEKCKKEALKMFVKYFDDLWN